MRKRIWVCLLLTIFLCSFSGCGSTRLTQGKLERLCNLSATEISYHSFVEATGKEFSSGLFAAGDTCYCEFDGVISIGVELISLNVSGKNVTVTISNLKILKSKSNVKSNPEYVISDDGIIKEKRELSLDGLNKIKEQAQSKMINSINEGIADGDYDFVLENAKLLIESFVEQIGEIKNIDYNVTFVTGN